MITVNFACPDQQLYVDITGGGSRELRDRTYAAMVNAGLGRHEHTVAWDGIGHAGFDLAVIAAILTIDNALDPRAVRALGAWTVAGHVSIDGTVTGGVFSNGSHTYRIRDLGELLDFVVEEIDLTECAS